MRSTFSEFSYGFSLTHEFCNLWFGSQRAAPVFPSLRAEGAPDVGYDVHLRRPGAPLFLQFKLSEWMVRRTASEWQLFNQPYCRFWLHAKRLSRQHEALLGHDIPPSVVLYAAPTLRTVDELNAAFRTRTVIASSVFVAPQSIGALPDDDPHCVAFLPGSSRGYFCSEPKPIRSLWFGAEVVEPLAKVLEGTEPVRPTPDLFNSIADEIEGRADVASQVRSGGAITGEESLRRSQRRAAFAARTILGAELLWMARTETA